LAFRLITALAAAAFAVTATAAAQDVAPSSLRADPFSALVGKRKPAAERARSIGAVERFVVATDDRVFLFQSDEREGRLKFLCSDNDPHIDCAIDATSPAEEIHLLEATRVSRGDVAWRNAEGQTLVRVAAYGGVTVYWPGEARGQAASKSFGEDPPLVLDPAGIETARLRAQRATAMISAKVGAPIVFEIAAPKALAFAAESARSADALSDETRTAPVMAASESAAAPVRAAPVAGRASMAARADANEAVLADAIVRAAKGIDAVADDPTGARVIATRLDRVIFRIERPPGLLFQRKSLIVGYDPGLGVAGRPSSARIARFLEESL